MEVKRMYAYSDAENAVTQGVGVLGTLIYS